MSSDFKEYKQYIGQGFLTSSKSPDRFVSGVYPQLLKNGAGPHVLDTNNRKYIDTISSLGSVILGYEKVPTIKGPASLSLGSPDELALAKKLNEFFPFVENWKFLKTGTEACMAAIRIARSYTGRETVLTAGYHGWSDEFISTLWDTGTVSGIPFSNSHCIQKMDGREWALLDTQKVAAVIVEPIETDASDKRIEFLVELKKRCDQTNTVLIFDEVITSLRYKSFSVSKFHGIHPDLIILGKALGNGVSISAIGGSDADILNNPAYFVSGTYCGERVGILSGLNTLNSLEKISKEDHGLFWDACKEFGEKLNEGFLLNTIPLSIEGYPTRYVFKGDEYYKALFWQEACKAGVLFGPSIFLNYSHYFENKIDSVLNISLDIMRKIRHTNIKLEGKLPTPAFHRKK